MAKRISEHIWNGNGTLKDLIGLYVYKSYESHNIGRIVGISDNINVLVKWSKPRNGQNITKEYANGLNDYEHLIADHQKKLNTHTKALEIAKSIL